MLPDKFIISRVGSFTFTTLLVLSLVDKVASVGRSTLVSLLKRLYFLTVDESTLTFCRVPLHFHYVHYGYAFRKFQIRSEASKLSEVLKGSARQLCSNLE